MLQETKQVQQEMKGIIDKIKQYEGLIFESRGASGGLATLWNHSVWVHKHNTTNQYWIKVTIETKNNVGIPSRQI